MDPAVCFIIVPAKRYGAGGSLDSYTHIERDGKHALLRADVAEALADAFLTGAGCEDAELGGRGAVARCAYPGGEALLRRYLRGGVLRRFLGDAFVLANRPMREFEAHKAALAAGLEVPPLLGVCWWRSGLLLRGSIGTGALDAQHLQAWLEGGPDAPEEMARRCGALIARMHDAGIWHADLQLRNILITAEGPYLIDFDGAKRMGRVPPLQRARNLLRLRRSLQKNGVSASIYNAVLEGYGGPPPPAWLTAVYALKGVCTDRIFGKR